MLTSGLSISQLLSGPIKHAAQSKMLWRLFRQFQEPEHFADEFAVLPQFQWTIEKRSGDLSCRAIKLLLRNQRDQRCETVALLTGSVSAPSQHPVAPPPQNHSQHAAEQNPSGQNVNERTAARRPRATACISTQIGCAVGCPFCATGKMGLYGNLTAVEIAEQVYWAGLEAFRNGFRMRNVVYMGMGEPLHNAKAVVKSIALLTRPNAFGLAERHITVSTIGVPSAMIQLVKSYPRIRLALSLHSVDPDLRKILVPRATSELTVLRETIVAINRLQARQTVWLEVVLLESLNDSIEHAEALVEFCRGLSVEVNLIPFNPSSEALSFRATTRERRESFAEILRSAGIRTTIRTSLGAEQSAACGQLTTKNG